MRETREFQPHVLQVRGIIDWTCPICETYNGGDTYLPERCLECGALLEWKVVVHYKKTEDAELS